MKTSLSHLPQLKQEELKLVVAKIEELVWVSLEKIILFGSYARGDWKDGPHEQGGGRLTIHKRSDYDILVITDEDDAACEAELCQKLNDEFAKMNLSTHVRVITHSLEFINLKLAKGSTSSRKSIRTGYFCMMAGANLPANKSKAPRNKNASPRNTSMKRSQPQKSFMTILNMLLANVRTRTQLFNFIRLPNMRTRLFFWSLPMSIPTSII